METLSWVIGAGNPLSATLTGPLLARLGRSPEVVRRAQRTGWAVLFVVQVTFTLFGWVSGLDGFRIAQPVMIGVAAMNYWLITHPDKKIDKPSKVG